MHHSPDLWNTKAPSLARQYRQLASWIEQHEVIPKSISLNWSRDALIIHLREETFIHAFQGKHARQNADLQGTTWLIEENELIFTCFIPNGITTSSTVVEISAQKESA